MTASDATGERPGMFQKGRCCLFQNKPLTQTMSTSSTRTRVLWFVFCLQERRRGRRTSRRFAHILAGITSVLGSSALVSAFSTLHTERLRGRGSSC